MQHAQKPLAPAKDLRPRTIFLPLLLLVIVGLTWFACRDSRDFFSEFDDRTVQAVFAGQVLDENEQPVPGARVAAGDATTYTDARGVFRLPAAALQADNAILTVSKDGYFDFVRAFLVKDDMLKTVTVQLLERRFAGQFQAGQGGQIAAGAARLKFPANAVAGADGAPYNGPVYVFARLLDPVHPDLGLHMPGDLRAAALDGTERTLGTFGMIGVQITDTGGDPLQIKNGEKVELTMPIVADQLASAPAQIPLWHFDESTARWEEEGSAGRVGNTYVGQVSHFSWWNCDIPYPLVRLAGQVKLSDGSPLANVHVLVCIDDPQNWGCTHGYTDAGGNFAGGVAKDFPLRIDIFGPCNQLIYSASIGSFSESAVLPAIVAPTSVLPGVTAFSGRLLDCNQQPLTDGYVVASGGGMETIAFTDAAGNFSGALISCSPINDLAVVGYDPQNFKESPVKSFSNFSSPLAIGDIEVCNSLSNYIQYQVDGQGFLVTQTSGALTGSFTSIQGQQASGQTANFIYLTFANNGQTGTFPVSHLSIWPSQDSLMNVNVTTTVTNFGAVQQPITGTFNGTYQNFNGQTHTLSGAYNVTRTE